MHRSWIAPVILTLVPGLVAAATYRRGNETFNLSRWNQPRQDVGRVPPDHPIVVDAEGRYEWHLYTGIRQMRAGLVQGSVENLVRAAGLSPYQPYVRRLLGHAYMRQGRYHAAADQYLRMAHLSRNPYRLEIDFQELYGEKVDYQTDLARLTKAVNLHPDDAPLVFLHRLYHYYRENYSGAVKSFQRAARIDPANGDYLQYLRYAEARVK